MADEGGFRPAQLASRESVGGGLTRVIVVPDGAIVGSYVQPGQYIEMRIGGETGFFVLASEPGASPWELIMRPGGGASDVVLAVPMGSPLEVTGALGQGFPLEAARGRPLAVVVNGTGVAAAPAVVRRRIRDGEAGRTYMFLGLRERSELPIEADLRAFRASGVEVVVCLSQTPASTGRVSDSSGLLFAPGYVQDVLRGHMASGSLARGRVFAVGTASMLEALASQASEMGLPREHIHTNA